MRAWFRELLRRRVITVGTAYAVVAWVLLEIAATIFPIFGAPTWVLKVFTAVLVLGFPVALVLAWAYETTPHGLVRAGRESADAPPLAKDAESPPAPADDRTLSLPPGPSIAVLPFRNLSGDESQELFAHAMAGDIVTGLTERSSLCVVSSGEAARDAAKGRSEAEVGRELGVRYVLQGAVNRDGQRLRVTAQLTDASRNVQMWSGQYDRELSASSLFAVQDDIREQIVAALSDFHGVIYSAETRKNVSRPTDSLDAYECLSVALAYDKYLSEEYHLRARESLERAVQLDPEFDSAWAHLSWIYTDEYVWGYNPLPKAMERALAAAQHAIKLAPTNYHSHWLLSRVHYFSGQRDLFFAEAEKSLALNASDGTTLGLIGGYMAFAGERERGLALIEKAKLLNPKYPDYYHAFVGVAELIEGNDSGALAEFQRMSTPEWPVAPMLLAGTSALAEKPELAARYAQSLIRLQPAIRLDAAREALRKTLPYQTAVVERLVHGLDSTGCWAAV